MIKMKTILLLTGLAACTVASPLQLSSKLDLNQMDILESIDVRQVRIDDAFSLKDQKEFVECLSGVPLEDILKAKSEEDIVFTISPVEQIAENSQITVRDPREMAEHLRGIPIETFNKNFEYERKNN